MSVTWLDVRMMPVTPDVWDRLNAGEEVGYAVSFLPQSGMKNTVLFDPAGESPAPYIDGAQILSRGVIRKGEVHRESGFTHPAAAYVEAEIAGSLQGIRKKLAAVPEHAAPIEVPAEPLPPCCPIPVPPVEAVSDRQVEAPVGSVS